MIPIEYLLLIGSGLILLAVALTRLSDGFAVPAFLLFLALGMLAGSEGPGGIYFDDAGLAQSIGVVALVFILFAGGFDTHWEEVRPVLGRASLLATAGVLVTTAILGLFATIVFNISLLNGLLLGAIVSSTDAAAVFSVLRSKNVSLRGNLKPLLEFESGSNDPMAVFLTVGFIQLLSNPGQPVFSLVLLFMFQMVLGLAFGFGFGRVVLLLLNRLKLGYEGLYTVFAIAFVALTYGATTVAGGSGFLAVYVAGLVAGNGVFVQKRSLLRFFDGLAWLSQIAMFLALGLLVFPSHILPIIGVGLLLSVFLMLVARPVSTFLFLSFSSLRWREKAFLSWVGLRGAVPVILATFPLTAKLPNAELIFNVVFFVVLTSALFQGWSIPVAARALNVDAPMKPAPRYPIEFAPLKGVDTQLVDLIVPFNSVVAGKSIVELSLPRDSLIVLISRNEEFLVPSGGTILQEGDTMLVLVNSTNLPAVRAILSEQNTPDS
jgi:cell volume regulation protein A